MILPPLPRSTILLVEVGSTAHGTGIPGGEDYDQLGVVVELAHEVLGLDPAGFRTVMQRTQPEGVRSGPGDIDRTLHSLRRFLRLAGSGNPSVLMALWAPIDDATDEGRELQALGDAFVGRHVVPRYRGYMQSQAQRLLGTRGEIDFHDWWATVVRLDQDLARLEHDEQYPPGPDRARIDRWAIEAHRTVWQRLSDD
ncbi:MAG TPA: nucleotidyltransferase domain-containing protein [Acidimicrobiales bacterium]|nr:nucleotidyltransferase domain-containing protein [Acidimicrobiales bacterium]